MNKASISPPTKFSPQTMWVVVLDGKRIIPGTNAPSKDQSKRLAARYFRKTWIYLQNNGFDCYKFRVKI